MKQAIYSELARQLESQGESWGLSLEERQVNLLLDYVRVLSTYELANVVGTRRVEALVRDHVLDSLSCRLFKPVESSGSLVDVGAGAGLPGIPLAITLPGSRVLLLEATKKKAEFLKYVVSHLGLENVEVLNGRAEEYARQRDYRNSFEAATARAVAALPTLVEYCLPLVRPGGYVVAMKARLSEEEAEAGKFAAQALEARLSEVIEVPHLTEVGEKERRLVIIEKLRKTPAAFPRAGGMPKKKPLGSGT